MSLDAVQLAAALIRCPSVTPLEAGALDLLQAELEKLGFTCTRLPFEEEGTARVDNLYARLGTAAPHFCFAGHVDVVAAGDSEAWTHDPFSGAIIDDQLWGRGAADMKGAIAAFIAAISQHLNQHGAPSGSVSLLITGDEEGAAINGTAKMLAWLAEQNQTIDDCLVGEPTNPETLGEMVKIGRRGSVNGVVTVHGTQGHVAYPDKADNPIPHLLRLVNALASTPLDNGTDNFPPSRLEITSFDVGNGATNIIPPMAQARFNIRYNDQWTRDSIARWIEDQLETVRENANMELTLHHTGESFLTQNDTLTELVSAAVEKITARKPELSTSGGTSDARFITRYAPVIEFGLCGQTMHKIDERVPVADIEKLVQIYAEILHSYFSA